MFSLIACVGKNNELGNKGGLCFHIKEDMQFFKNTTMGHGVIMGDRTFFSLPKALPGRTNYVLTHHPENFPSDLPENVVLVTDMDGFIDEHLDSETEIFVIGGGFVYKEFLPLCKNLYLTEVDSEAKADTYFPEFDKSLYTKTIIQEGSNDDLNYSFVKYTKNN